MTEVETSYRVKGHGREPIKDVLVDLGTNYAMRVRHFRNGQVEMISLVGAAELPGVVVIEPTRYAALVDALARPSASTTDGA